MFLPEIAHTIDRGSIRFLPQAYFADLTTGEDKIIDLRVEVQQAGKKVGFLVQIETQSYSERDEAISYLKAELHRWTERLELLEGCASEQGQ